MTRQGKWEYNNARKYKYWKLIFACNTNVELDGNTQWGEKSIHFVSRCLEEKKYQGGLGSSWNAFLFNVFNSIRYLRRWGKLFHANVPEKKKLILKISVLVLGKSCLFQWTWRRSEGIMSSFRYCGALPRTTFCIRTHLLSNSCLSRGSHLRTQHFCL